VPPLKKGGEGTPATTDPRKALTGATTVRSGTFDLSIDVKSRNPAERVGITANGRFQSRGLVKTPRFEVNLTAKGRGGSIDVAAVSTGDQAFLVRDGKALVLQTEGWDALTRARLMQSKGGPLEEPHFGYSDKELDSLQLVGEEDLNGTPVLHFRGHVGVKETRKELKSLAELFSKTSLGSPVPWTLARSLQAGTIDVWVGEGDHIVRRERERLTASRGTVVTYDYKRANLGEPQKISAPAGASKQTPTAAGWARDTFGLAFSALTVGALAIEPSDGTAAQARRQDARRSAPKQEPKRSAPENRDRNRGGSANTNDIRRAVDQRKIVILFFRQRGADDDAVAAAVKSQRGRKNVAVFILPVGQAPKYEQFGGGNVVRAPSIVILDRDRKPRLFEGFIDPATLAQAVTDAR
jgi:hypothetical protein